MKILHTSDWHLGHQLYGYDRTDEFIGFFSNLTKIISDEKPDALLVSGDIFDVSTPSASVARMFKDNLIDIRNRFSEMEIVVTAGNHDSASRIDIDRNLWKAGGIHVIGSVKRSEGKYDFSENIIEIPGKGFIAAIPFVNRAFMPSGKEVRGETAFFRGVKEEMKRRNTEGLPSVLMAHLAVEGSDMRGHKNSIVGGIDSVNSEIFGSEFDYIALGHIHKSQEIVEGKIAYSGSPVAISFDEDYVHGVYLVELSRGEKSKIRQIEIEPLRRLKTFPREAVDFKKALKMLSGLPENDNSYIRLNVRQEEDLPYGCSEMASEKVKGKECRYCTIKFENVRKSSFDKINESEMSAESFYESSPIEIAKRYFDTLMMPESVSSRYVEMIEDIMKEIEANDSF